MALIRCPECAHAVSDKAECCVHCGYPLEEYVKKLYSTCEINGIPMDLTYILNAKTEEEQRKAVYRLKKETDCTLRHAKLIVDYIVQEDNLPAGFVTLDAGGKDRMGLGPDINVIQRDHVNPNVDLW